MCHADAGECETESAALSFSFVNPLSKADLRELVKSNDIRLLGR